MEAVMTYAQAFFGWLLQTTLIASLVICLILLIQKMLDSKLGPRWCHALWLVLLIRMVLPWAPSSRFSLSNLITSWRGQPQSQQSAGTVEIQEVSPIEHATETSEAITSQEPESELAAEKQVEPGPQIVANTETRSAPRPVLLRRILPILWLAGAIVIGVYLLVSDLALWRIVKRDRPLVNQSMLELFEECKAQMGVQSLVVVVPSDRVRSPGLFGFVRPRLLLPLQMLNMATTEEIRYVFLHELAHLRRHDIYLGWLTSLLQVLHWFNPLVWFAFYRMRADRELACDALVLTRTGQEKSQEYGGAIVELVRRFSRSRPLPAMAGIIESKSQLKRRIAMITKFRNKSYRWSPLAVILIVILAFISLPNAISTKASEASTPQPGANIMFRRVCSSTYPITDGEPSPDGRYFSYTDWQTGDLAIYEIATGAKRRLTNKGTWDDSDETAYSSRWSPDGKQIVYSWEMGPDLVELRLIKLDGSEPQTLYRTDEQHRWVEPCGWFPEGRHILASLTGKDGTDKIVRISVDDSSLHVLKTVGKDCLIHSKLSPNGQYIAYDFKAEDDDSSSNLDISLISLDEDNEIPLIKHPAIDFVLGWAPDGKNILFASDRTGTLGIWMTAIVDGKPWGEPKLVKQIVDLFEPLGFTEDGSYYYGTSRGSDDIFIATLDQQTGKIIAPLKKAVQQHEGSNLTAAYSPDGKYLAYIYRLGFVSRNRNRRNILCIRSLETGKEREFPLNLVNVRRYSSPRWYPDGSSILVSGLAENDKVGIYNIDVQTGEVKYLAQTHTCEWSADGKTVFHSRNDRNTKTTQIIARDPKTGQERLLCQPPLDKFVFNIALSPDGQWLALRCIGPTSLYVLPASGGQARELSEFEKVASVHKPIAWTADSKYVLFSGNEPGGGKNSLYRISAQTGKTEKTGLQMNRYYGLSAHPDGQHILISGREDAPESEVWVMKNFLPEAPVATPINQPMFTKIRIPNRLSSEAQLSPDGKSIALVSEKKLWIVPISSRLGPDYPGAPRLLDTGGVEVAWSGLTWSVDGRWIAFNGRKVEAGNQCIYVVSAEGGGPRRVYENNRDVRVVNYRMSLSPHGETLAFSSVDANEVHIYTLPVKGGSPKRLVEAPAREPVFSPDGKTIAYVEDKDLGRGGGGLWTVSADGGTPTLVAEAGNASSPVWSPNGKMIAFIDYGADNQVYIVPVGEDGRPAGEKFRINLPEGTKGAMRLTGWTPNNVIGALLGGQMEFALYIQPLQRGIATFVTHGAYPVQPRWSPDGKRVYHTNKTDAMSGDWTRYAIAYVPAEGGDVTTVPIKSEHKIRLWAYGTGNRISPDGKTIVFAGQKPQEGPNMMHIWTIPIDGGEPRQLTDAPAAFRDWYPCWSPDGENIAFVRMEAPENWAVIAEADIYVISADGGEPRQVTSESDRVFASGPVLWSPDGKLLAYFSRDKDDAAVGTLKVISPYGGQPRIVARVDGIYANKEMAWSPDSKRIAYNTRDNKIKIVSLDNGSIEEIRPDLKDVEIYHLDWSPDGENLVFGGSIGGGRGFWLLENFLPVEMGK